MKELAAFLLPLLWLLPVVVAVVNRVKAAAPKLPGYAVTALAVAVGILGALISTYFPVLPLPSQLVVAGVLLGLGSSGVFDLAKIFGTLTLPSDGGGAGA